MDEFRKWMRAAWLPRYKGRPPRRRKAPTYWWGEFARMRIPASRGMAELNREADRMRSEEDEGEGC
jgi:hypothetical protein